MDMYIWTQQHSKILYNTLTPILCRDVVIHIESFCKKQFFNSIATYLDNNKNLSHYAIPEFDYYINICMKNNDIDSLRLLNRKVQDAAHWDL